MSCSFKEQWTCSTCAWWWNREPLCHCKKGVKRPDADGECHRFPPVPAVRGRAWPRTEWSDGCGEWKIFFRIILPMVKPSLVTLGIFTFIMSWNSFVWPLVITSDIAKMPISVGITTYFGKEIAPWGKIAALSVTGILPPLILFLALQRYYIKGLMISGIK